VQAWLPGALADEPAISIRMLLGHTSGIFNVGDEGDVVADIGRIEDPDLRRQTEDLAARYLAGEAVIAPAAVWVALARTHPLYFDAGAGYHYSNVNYQLAGMVLEEATGKDYATLLHERMAVPLGLSSTTTAPDDLRMPDLRSYTREGEGGALRDTTTDLLAVGNGGSGGVVSTAGELLDMFEAIIAGDLLPTTLRSEMVAPTAQSDGTYGLGVVTFVLSCGDYLGHAGAIAGMHALALVSSDGDTGAVLAANRRGEPEPDLLQAGDELLCQAL
jgi:D-alanyl-D-alanine carboxypeptidase